MACVTEICAQAIVSEACQLLPISSYDCDGWHKCFIGERKRKSDIFNGALRCEVTPSEFTLLKCVEKQKQHDPPHTYRFLCKPCSVTFRETGGFILWKAVDSD